VADLGHGTQALRQVIDTYTEIAKSVVDHDPRDVDTLSSVNRYLNEILDDWNPERENPQAWELELYEHRGDVDPQRLAELRRGVQRNETRIRAKEDVSTWRDVQRFALLWWIQRRFRETGDDSYIGAWDSFIGYFGNLSAAARVLDRAVQAEHEDRGQWMHWIPTPSDRGVWAGEAIDLAFLQTFILIALTHIDPGGRVPEFEPLDWARGRLGDVDAAVQAVLNDERVDALIPRDGREARGAILTEALTSMLRAEEEREEQRVIDSPLDEEAVSEFRRRVRAEWADHRLLASGFQHSGTYETLEEDIEAEGRYWGSRRWMPKSVLIGDGHFGGSVHAAELGRRLGLSEATLVARAAGGAPTFVGAEGASLAELLRAALADLGEADARAVLAPHHWRLPDLLELTLSEGRGGPAPYPRWLPAKIRDRFMGTADGVPIVESAAVPEDRLLAFSFDRLAMWRQWRARGEHEVSVEIDTFDDEEAREYVIEHPEQFRTPERTTDEARARELRKHVRLDVHERLQLEVVDVDAARWLPVGDIDV
jgi:hypothetical protein